MPYPPDDIADHLQATIPLGVQVYGHPAGQIAAPAIVVTAGDPWQAPYSQGGPGAVAYGLEFQLVIVAGDAAGRYRRLDELRRQVTAAIASAPHSVRWLTCGRPEAIEDTDLLQSTLTAIAVADE